MKLAKTVNLGKFGKFGNDFKDGDLLTVLSEGDEIEGKYGMQLVFRVKYPNDGEGNLAFNATSRNKLIDAYGDETKKWIGQKVKVWVVKSMIQGKLVNVVYLTSPDQSLEDSADGLDTINIDG